MRSFASLHGIPVLGMIPFDQGVSDNGIDGRPLDQERSPALHEVSRLASDLESVLLPENGLRGRKFP